jgi:DNA-binding transcriptional LysR family regulator
MVLGSIDAIKQAVSVDLGFSPIPLSAVTLELKLGLIKELNVGGISWSYPYCLIHNKNRYLSPAARKLKELVCKRMSQTENIL